MRNGIRNGTVAVSAPEQKKPLEFGGLVPQDAYKLEVAMKTGKGSALGIGNFPIFKYDASAGGGAARVEHLSSSSVRIVFNPEQLKIPSVTWRTARFLGAPLPPIFRINIRPSKLEGTIDLSTGVVELHLSAQFFFQAAGLYKAPPMAVDTRLTTEAVKSAHHDRVGSRLDCSGRAVLVGVGDVSRTGHWLLDKLLRLPTDVLGLMTSQFEWRPEVSSGLRARQQAPQLMVSNSHKSLGELQVHVT